MSTNIVVADNGRVVLAADSRFMKADYSTVDSDCMQKIHEIAPGTFFACSGWTGTIEYQEMRARELAAELGGFDIQAIAEALERDSISFLRAVLEYLPRMRGANQAVDDAIAGNAVLHSFSLCGKSGGKPGYVACDFQVKNGKVVSDRTASFGGANRRHIHVTGAAPSYIQAISKDPRTWTDPPVQVASRILADLKKASPFIGGANQIVLLEGDRAHWISRPPQPGKPSSKFCSAVMTSAVTVTGPSNGYPTVIPAPNHKLSTGVTVKFSGGAGNWAALNGHVYPVTRVDNDHFSIPVNSSTWGPLTGSLVYAITRPGLIQVVDENDVVRGYFGKWYKGSGDATDPANYICGMKLVGTGYELLADADSLTITGPSCTLTLTNGQIDIKRKADLSQRILIGDNSLSMSSTRGIPEVGAEISIDITSDEPLVRVRKAVASKALVFSASADLDDGVDTDYGYSVGGVKVIDDNRAVHATMVTVGGNRVVYERQPDPGTAATSPAIPPLYGASGTLASTYGAGEQLLLQALVNNNNPLNTAVANLKQQVDNLIADRNNLRTILKNHGLMA